jgi:hypothetical protein
MLRREFAKGTLATVGVGTMTSIGLSEGPDKKSGTTAMRCALADLSTARVAYIERGSGPVALFLRGFPLNGYQLRGAIERLSRRCITADVIGLGYTEVPTAKRSH